MGVLQDEFDRVLTDMLSTGNVAKAVLRRILVRRGIEFNEEQLTKAANKIVEAPEQAEQGSISLEVGFPDKHYDLGNDDLAAALAEFAASFTHAIGDAVPKTVEELWPRILNSLYSDLPKALRHARGQQRRFEKRLYARWRDGIDRLEMMLIIAREAGGLFLTDVRKAHDDVEDGVTPEDFFLLDALVRIHVRSCRIASEVLHLLQGGYSDGANARWRSLHENAVIATFISQHGSDTAKRYLRHSAVERYRVSASYQEHCEAIGESTLTEIELAELKAEYDGAILEFGRDFKNQYGWAAHAIGVPSPTFADIEHHLDMSQWRPYFKIACHSVHAGSQGLFFSLSDVDDDRSGLIAGASNVGLCDPGHCCAISLTMVSAATFTAKNTVDGLVALKVMLQLCEDIGNAFDDASKKRTEDVERDDERRPVEGE